MNNARIIIVASLVVVILLILFTRKLFWIAQPIRHIYQSAQPHIIESKKTWTKHCDFRIRTFKYDESYDPGALVEFIQKKSTGFLNPNHIKSYLLGAHVSILVIDQIVQGISVSRPVHFALQKTEQPAEFYEYLLGDEKALLSTHEYYRPLTPAFFTRNSPIPLLVPLVKYPIYWIPTSKYRNYKTPCVKITVANIETLRQRLTTSSFACRIVPSMERLFSLIDCKTISVYCTPHSTFIFKNNMEVEFTKSVLDLICVIGKSSTSKSYAAFASLMYETRSTYGWVRIHGLSDFTEIHRKSPSKTTTRYIYAYNYFAPRLQPNECLII
jgi:hypothetical protein